MVRCDVSGAKFQKSTLILRVYFLVALLGIASLTTLVRAEDVADVPETPKVSGDSANVTGWKNIFSDMNPFFIIALVMIFLTVLGAIVFLAVYGTKGGQGIGAIAFSVIMILILTPLICYFLFKNHTIPALQRFMSKYDIMVFPGWTQKASNDGKSSIAEKLDTSYLRGLFKKSSEAATES
ncbi:uncharacterized protein BXIN_2804 [Babesia sp. Xinjiang]|uniref:uncharacterized protein n=1 Tax=Babesia sp. Xinjiang TaxID=462227 RepID=UPI000A25C92E|nr:uncharacterized protein BXIN_2804 [Babesia sp. Xinjiang]ORM41759.1 hypothetical protein BXIN_2804 [Babesia sp. Xinjiang]